MTPLAGDVGVGVKNMRHNRNGQTWFTFTVTLQQHASPFTLLTMFFSALRTPCRRRIDTPFSFESATTSKFTQGGTPRQRTRCTQRFDRYALSNMCRSAKGPGEWRRGYLRTHAVVLVGSPPTDRERRRAVLALKVQRPTPDSTSATTRPPLVCSTSCEPVKRHQRPHANRFHAHGVPRSRVTGRARHLDCDGHRRGVRNDHRKFTGVPDHRVEEAQSQQ